MLSMYESHTATAPKRAVPLVLFDAHAVDGQEDMFELVCDGFTYKFRSVKDDTRSAHDWLRFLANMCRRRRSSLAEHQTRHLS